MCILGAYVHNIDPILGTVGGVHLWWYGLSYSLGFLNIFLFVHRRRESLDFSLAQVYALTLFVTVGVLLGGRVVEVVFYEWPFYRAHPWLIPAYWLGGMATHGLLVGAVGGVVCFCRIHRRPFLTVTDALVVPAAFIMGVGRIGNFIDGQIVGSVTDVWWAVKFPDAEGYRHPVVLYDGIKNLALIPFLLWVAGRKPHRGVLTGLFLFLYAFLRIFIDFYREYPTTLLGIATGQGLNVAMSAIGLVLVLRKVRSRSDTETERRVPPATQARLVAYRLGFVALLLFSLTIPSDWTQDIPSRYGNRHPGLRHSVLYPRIDTTTSDRGALNPPVGQSPSSFGNAVPSPCGKG